MTIPDGAKCARPITTLTDLVACVDCVSELDVERAVAARTPQFMPYPVECAH